MPDKVKVPEPVLFLIVVSPAKVILPEAVAEKTDGYLGVRYEKIIPLLIQSIKELQLEINELKNSN